MHSHFHTPAAVDRAERAPLSMDGLALRVGLDASLKIIKKACFPSQELNHVPSVVQPGRRLSADFATILELGKQ